MADAAAIDAALEVLLSAELDPIVDMVLRRCDDGYEALAHGGSVRFRRTGPGPDGYETTAVEAKNPFDSVATDRRTSLADEQAHRYPTRATNSYPFAFDHTAQLFDSPCAPDLCVIHSAAHNWEDQGGHRGEHGSLGLVQARAPWIIAGQGVRADGVVARSARVVDVAPTVAALLGCRPIGRNGRGEIHLEGQDGEVRHDVLEPGATPPRIVIGCLFDGTNSNVLSDMTARGEAPNVARLMEMGTTFGHGLMSGLPTVTLANHTSIMTARLPGHHGILHNAWFDRSRGEQIITNSSATWPTAMDHVTPGVQSLHDAIHASFPGSFTASVNEPCDIGADYSTFEFFRRGDVPPIPETPDGLPHTTERFVRPSKDYSWSSIVDHMGTEQAVSILGGSYRDEAYPEPKFLFANFTLTDSAMHEGGPYSEVAAASVRDSDARLGEILAAVEQAGMFDEAAFFLVADHGMEESNPAVRGNWGVNLTDAGITFRDEGYSFIYVDEK